MPRSTAKTKYTNPLPFPSEKHSKTFTHQPHYACGYNADEHTKSYARRSGVLCICPHKYTYIPYCQPGYANITLKIAIMPNGLGHPES